MNEVNVDLEALPIGEDAPELVNVVIEVPVGSRNKYEYEPELGVIVRDRVLQGNVRFPADYGFLPSTESADGEPPGCYGGRLRSRLSRLCAQGPRHRGFGDGRRGGDGVQHLRRTKRRSPLRRHRGPGGYA